MDDYRSKREGRWVIETQYPDKEALVVVTVQWKKWNERHLSRSDVPAREPLGRLLVSSEKKGEKSDRCVQVEPDMVLDINTEGKLIGIELVTPELVTLEAVNGVLEDYGFQPLDASDLKPLLAA